MNTTEITTIINDFNQKHNGNFNISQELIELLRYSLHCYYSICYNELKQEYENQQIESDRIALLQYKNLRKHFGEMVHTLLGESYYNLAMDVYDCDRIACEDIIKKYK